MNSIRHKMRLFLATAVVCSISSAGFAQDARNRVGSDGTEGLPPVDTAIDYRTESPRATLRTWLSATREMEQLYEDYRRDHTRESGDRFGSYSTIFLYLMDLSRVPEALREEAGYRAANALLDILARVDLPPIDTVPEWDPFEDAGPATWRIPGTPVSISRVDSGPRIGEFLFSASTVDLAPGYYERIKSKPPVRPTPVDSWTESIPQITGPMISPYFVDRLPDLLKRPYLDTPAWKIVVSTALLGFLAAIFLLVIRQMDGTLSRTRISHLGLRSLLPLLAILLNSLFQAVTQAELNVTGSFARVTNSITTMVSGLAWAWLFWLAALALFEWVVRSPRIPDDSLYAGVLRLSAKLLGLFGVLIILAQAVQRLGIPVFGVLAGLGFGGLAAALAVRPTLENLIGGIILFIDKPVAVGDYCSFGNFSGTVEHIGIRSIKIRAQDRTLISVPNSNFVNLELVNWTKADEMLIQTEIGLRYETTPDQLRHVLAKLREMLYAHPKIDRNTVRVRFAGYGPYSLQVMIRVYAASNDWDEFHAIREDVFLRVNQIIAESGTDFAIPSQILYHARDTGLDKELSRNAEQEVAEWRSSRSLPFPDWPVSRVDELAGTLDYPPHGSVEERQAGPESRQAAERPVPATGPDSDRKG